MSMVLNPCILNLADGPFRNILRIMGLVQIFPKFRRSIRLYLKQEVEIRKIRTNYETTMIFTFEKLAKGLRFVSNKDSIKKIANYKFFAGT